MLSATVFFAIALALLALAGCGLFSGLVGTEIVVKGRHRSLREQVLGSFDMLEEEVYELAGVRSIDPVTGAPKAPPQMTESKRQALAARQSMEFNRDDVLHFERAGYVGEGNNGLPVFFEDQKRTLKAQDSRLFKLVLEVCAEEARDRQVIMRRIVETNPELEGKQGLEAVRRILAEKFRQQAEPGTRIQLPDGRWVLKGAAEAPPMTRARRSFE